ncbi:MAG: tRNA 5-methoxyuridine(34)/uridine 5-oxyacetic acid(34) synthase CmoB [bacterium]
MFDFDPLFQRLGNTCARRWLDTLPGDVEAALAPGQHGRLTEWQQAILQMPDTKARHLDLGKPVLEIGLPDELSEQQYIQLKQSLQNLIPWRKGPFNFFGINIDTEWRSDWKWQRIAPHITPLRDRWVLDVGCGSGYHCWRMHAEGADQVIGIDPTLLFNMQFQATKKFIEPRPVDMLPLPLEALPGNLSLFDSVFSMGVLYHRRSPFDHLMQLRDCLKPGGELILETIIVDGEEGFSFIPEGRYARMRNVWFLPSIPTLTRWLQRCQFEQIKVVDINITSTDEQRSTPWMPAESLADALDPQNRQKTVEGYPAPKRATFIAKRS